MSTHKLPQGGRPARIVVATALNFGDAEYKNMGDVAMLQVTVTRLAEVWPAARIEVLTDSAVNLSRYCPGASALSRPDCACWLSDHFFIGRFTRFLPNRLAVRLHALKRGIGFSCPGFIGALTSLRLMLSDPKGIRENLNRFKEAIASCDLMVVCGSGGFADSCREWNFYILSAMAAAIRHRKRVVMFGQGVGPLSDSVVLSWAKRVLPRVDLIALRGTSGDKEILEAIGVDLSKMITTGDDALEPANIVPLAERRDAIGINLRAAFYSGVETELVEKVGVVLRKFATRRHATPLPLPIAFHDCANDRTTIRRLFAGLDLESDGGGTLDTPRKIMEQTARCRVVVTGAYHAAVFALGQGIPVVCISNSSYYDAKFQGLERLFGAGCTTVHLDDSDFMEKLHAAIDEAWTSSDTVRASILQSAVQQIEKGQAAYRMMLQLPDLSAMRESQPVATRAERIL